jgi:hypothetical protein
MLLFYMFPEFLISRNEDPNFEKQSPEDLAKTLRTFYACVRTKEGTEYSRSGYRNLRSGLQRHLVSAPYSRTLDLRSDRVFLHANQVYEGKLKQIKMEGKDKTVHKKAINENDLKKMYSSGVLSDANPVALQRKVFFELSLHFGRRGRENWRSLTKDSFIICTDPAGRRYVSLAYQEFDKNHREQETKDQYMFESPDDENCPVESFVKYISKLNPSCSAFLQRPDPNFHNKPFWYVNAPLGIHTIATIMKSISQEASTSVTYTNHCVKATTGTVLKKAGFSNKDIMAVTGHKNVASLDSYIADPDIEERASMSNVLSKYGKVISNAQSGNSVASGTITSKEQCADNLEVISNKTLNISDVCSSVFAGAHFSGQVTINVNVNQQ